MKVSAAVSLIASARALAISIRAPPGVPSTSTARSLLNGLEVASSGSGDGYQRLLFPTWETIEGTCNTREFVLKRDGSNVVTNSGCVAESGQWVSPYDGMEFDEAHGLDIDHMVPLKNAWISGASNWTTEQRKAFANDITRPQLWAVSAHSNRAKGDESPDEWKPALEDFWCTYSKSWIQVKSYYDLTVTEDESDALSSMLDTC
ncbi:hypothetical protein E4U55_003146 [Claviceps digitariae]|nr:hypothetical protein E4U55_003146 [Claviceps digitariae]